MSNAWLMVLASLLFATDGRVRQARRRRTTRAGEIVLLPRRWPASLLMMPACDALARAGTRRHSASRRCTSGAACPACAALMPVVLRNRRPAAGHRDDAQLHELGLDGAVPDRRRGACSAARASTAGCVATVLVGFVGVAMVLRPTIERDQLWRGLLGLLSGMLSALAYLQVTALGRVGEPEERVVFYFSLGGVIAGALSTPLTSASGGFHGHTLKGAALLLAVGVLATAAQLLMTRAYASGRVLVNASLQYLGIVYAFIFGALLFDDAVPPLAIAGMLLIVGAGLAATLLRNRSAAAAARRTRSQFGRNLALSPCHCPHPSSTPPPSPSAWLPASARAARLRLRPRRHRCRSPRLAGGALAGRALPASRR